MTKKELEDRCAWLEVCLTCALEELRKTFDYEAVLWGKDKPPGEYLFQQRLRKN